jgi:hypothetical protein
MQEFKLLNDVRPQLEANSSTQIQNLNESRALNAWELRDKELELLQQHLTNERDEEMVINHK